MTTRKNTDYSKSAVNETDQSKALSNPPETANLYKLWREQMAELNAVLEQVEASIPAELREQRNAIEASLLDTRKDLETAIRTYGGFQNLETGEYALLQGKNTFLYNGEKFREFYPHLAGAVLNLVNTEVLYALIKAETLKEVDLENQGIIKKKKLTPAVIIK